MKRSTPQEVNKKEGVSSMKGKWEPILREHSVMDDRLNQGDDAS